jgi:hypothetical protein
MLTKDLTEWTLARLWGTDPLDVEIECGNGPVPFLEPERVVIHDTYPTDIPSDNPTGLSKRVYSNNPIPSPHGRWNLSTIAIEAHLCFKRGTFSPHAKIGQIIEIARVNPESGKMQKYGGMSYSAHQHDIIREHVRVCRRGGEDRIHIYVNSIIVVEQ